MIPEFFVPNGQDEGKFEEEVLWECSINMLEYFYNKGLKNIIALDFDDVRTREIPKIFKGKSFMTIKLICSDYEQNRNQMITRGKSGLLDLELLKNSTEKIMNRSLLPNEVILDVARKTKEEVLKEAINLIDTYKPLLDYEYKLANKEFFYSWVKSSGLRN